MLKTELVFILDKSGSMAGLEADTVGGFNTMLKKQANEEGEVNVTTILFSDEMELLHDRFPIHDVRPLQTANYEVGGLTALYDAIGAGIKKIENVLQYAGDRKVIFVISTDGEENASEKYTLHQIKKSIQMKRELGWEFLFLGANIDAIQAANTMGIPEERAVEYIADSIGTEKNFYAMSEAISYMRKGNKLSQEWKKDIEQDVKTRKK